MELNNISSLNTPNIQDNTIKIKLPHLTCTAVLINQIKKL